MYGWVSLALALWFAIILSAVASVILAWCSANQYRYLGMSLSVLLITLASMAIMYGLFSASLADWWSSYWNDRIIVGGWLSVIVAIICVIVKRQSGFKH